MVRVSSVVLTLTLTIGFVPNVVESIFNVPKYLTVQPIFVVADSKNLHNATKNSRPENQRLMSMEKGRSFS